MPRYQHDPKGEVAHLQTLHAIQRCKLALLTRQAASYGGEERAPLHVQNQLVATRAELVRLATELAAYGATPPDEEPAS